ncbi:hypothetical protein AYO38_11755 [bacterium SCGC AG-212-C10]|nr:hypothetical protein AYO38_11755 [bacterium SCGC AG-212-C10]
MAKTKNYQHFCPVARSLEVIGEKWSLLIVRDLLGGPRRFSDLQESLGKITAKWLTLRLRELELVGIVTRDSEEGRREVWYTLTPRGRELAPVVAALNVWGVKNALRPPLPGERVSLAAVFTSAIGFFITQRLSLPTPRTWVVHFNDGRTAVIRYDGKRWRWAIEDECPSDADVRIETTPEAWATFYALRGEERKAALLAMLPSGDADAIEELLATFDGQPMAVTAAR